MDARETFTGLGAVYTAAETFYPSGSYSLKPWEQGYAEYLARLHRIFDECAVEGIVTAPDRTAVYMGTVG